MNLDTCAPAFYFSDEQAAEIRRLAAEELKKVAIPRYYSRKETAGILQVSTVTLDKYQKDGLIEANKIRGRILYSHDAIHQALESLPVKFSRR